MAIDWQVVEWLAATHGSRIGRARHVSEPSSALLKVACGSDPGLFRREYELTRSLQVPGVLRPVGLLADGETLAMVLEDEPLVSLAAVLEQQRLDGPGCLRLGLSLARALAALHAANLVHGDLRPANLLFDPGSKAAWIADLSAAAQRGDEPRMVQDWAYASPEQTGRMNRVVDHRTDFYALGILLYRMLTGRLPFEADDPLEWVHCHIARVPQPPAELSPTVPLAVSDLVMKLLAKTAEDRYQSAHGLQADLMRCISAWEMKGRIEPFALGTDDTFEQLRVAQSLYGREAETAALLSAWERVATSGQPEVVLVCGDPGVGKTSLVNELHKPLVCRRGNFIAGKFDEHQRDVPYSALTQAFSDLVQQMLSEPEEAIASRRRALQGALGGNGRIIVDMLPSLELVIGPQASVSELGPAEAEHRLRMVFRQFIGACASEEHPLVLFLDDLQWADAASLALVREVTTHVEIRSLLLVGAYRDNQVDALHPLMLMLEQARKDRANISRIALRPLNSDDVAAFVADTLKCALDDARPLADLIHDKTAGNPFFTIQFLRELHAERSIEFDRHRRRWRWNVAHIRAKDYTDNVIELMVGKLRRLPPRTQQVLQRAACLGARGETSILATVLGRPLDDVIECLVDAARKSLVACAEGDYRFTHDHVQEAAYALIPESERAAAHLQTGRVLLERLPQGEIEERVFAVAKQLNLGASLITDAQEADRLARMNMLAGRKARAAIAFVSARDYLLRAAALWPANAWEAAYDDTLALHLDLAECEYLVGNFERSDELLQVILLHARANLDRAKAYSIRIKLHVLCGRFGPAAQAALDGLRQLGMVFPDNEDDARAMCEAERSEIAVNLAGRSIADLLDAPTLTDPVVRTQLRLLTDSFSAVYFGRPFEFPLVVMKAMNLALRYGNCEESCIAYTYYARVLVLSGDSASALAYSEMSLRLIERLPDRKLRGRLLLGHCGFVHCWRAAFARARPLLEQSFVDSVQMGSLVYASFVPPTLLQYLLEAGAPLDELLDVAEKAMVFLTCSEVTLQVVRGWEQFIKCLKGWTHAPDSLDDAAFSEARHVAGLTAAGHIAGLVFHQVEKQVLSFFAGRYGESLDWAAQATTHFGSIRGAPIEVTHHFYRALALAALCPHGAFKQQPKVVEGIEPELCRFERWSRDCPENFLDRHTLLCAELARMEGRDLDAERLYEQAIGTAHKYGFEQNAALAYERAASFYRERGFEKFANTYLREARERYAHWGADGKVQQLDAQHPQLREAGLAGAVQLDALAVAKASQAISSRIDLDELIDALLRIALENAGAQAGLLYFVEGEKLVLSATATVKGQQLEVCINHGGAEQDDPRPMAILNYVRRTRKQVLLSDAGKRNPFSGDPYLQQRMPKSVLCLPLMRGAELIGVLYLENNLATHAFTPDRTAVLTLLAAQAAISVEVARLYAVVKQENAERRRAEQISRERLARIHQLVDSNIIGIEFSRLDGDIVDANDAFLQVVGYTRDDLAAGRLNHLAITPPAYSAADARARDELLRGGRYTPFEKEYIRKDGTRVPVLVGGTLFSGSEGSPQLVEFVLDLTERRRATAEREARNAAEMANRAKSEFLSNMSHEFRTPLNGILGYAQILMCDHGLDEQQARAISVIKKSGDHLLTLINDILDLSKIEAGKQQVEPAPMRLLEFLRDIGEVIGVKADQEGLALERDFAEDLPEVVVADERRLRQVLLNLLGNAVKFTDRGSIAFRVRRIHPAAAGARLRFEIQDTGVGIRDTEVEAVFEPFEQAGDVGRRVGGTGLGLSISRQLVRLMGGEVEVRSQFGVGSLFSFELELPVVDESPPDVVHRSDIIAYAGPRRRLLVVDDIAENRDILRALLVPLGFEVAAEAVNGQDALHLAASLRPDLVLIDMIMPVMGGPEAIRRMRATPLLAKTPVIAISATATPCDQKEPLAAGADAFLPKPLIVDDLLQQIGRLLKLDWVYRVDHAPRADSLESLVPPPGRQMQRLLELARMGNMREIRKYADAIAGMGRPYRPFAARIRRLADGYQSKAILDLVRAYSEH